MRRVLPDEEGRPAKRLKSAGGQGEEYQEVGRFDYGAVAELRTGQVCGFLLTCNFRNEKTATKEANQLLVSYLAKQLQQKAVCAAGASAAPAPADTPAADTNAEECVTANAAHDADKDTKPHPSSSPLLSIVKLGCRGVVMLKLSTGACAAAAPAATAAGAIRLPSQGAQIVADEQQPSQLRPAAAATRAAAGSESQHVVPAEQLVQSVAKHLLADVEAGRVPRLRHCQRIVPVVATCALKAAALERAAAQLADVVVGGTDRAGAAPAGGADLAKNATVATSSPDAAAEGSVGQAAVAAQQEQKLSFGVAYKPRGSEAGAATGPANPGVASGSGIEGEQTGDAKPSGGLGADLEAGGAVMDRMQAIKAVAGGFERALKERHGVQARVDLKAPEWVVLVEVLPVMGVSYVALAVLPAAVCIVKPRLHMRAVGQGK